MFIEFFKRFLPGVKSFHDMVQDRKNYIDALRRTTPSLLRKYLNHVTDRRSMKEIIRRLYCYNDHSIRYQFGFTDNRAYGGELKSIFNINRDFGLAFNESEIRFYFNRDLQLADYDYETTIKETLAQILRPYDLMVAKDEYHRNIITPVSDADKELATYCRNTWD
jgi:hypothetical protein